MHHGGRKIACLGDDPRCVADSGGGRDASKADATQVTAPARSSSDTGSPGGPVVGAQSIRVDASATRPLAASLLGHMFYRPRYLRPAAQTAVSTSRGSSANTASVYSQVAFTRPGWRTYPPERG